jgi:hypothetical protein
LPRRITAGISDLGPLIAVESRYIMLERSPNLFAAFMRVVTSNIAELGSDFVLVFSGMLRITHDAVAEESNVQSKVTQWTLKS